MEQRTGHRTGGRRLRVRMGAAVAALAVVVAAGCVPPSAERAVDPAPPIVDPGSQLIGCDQAADRVVVTASAHLDPACTYTGGFEISTSRVVLDCRGAQVEDPEGDSGVGILVTAPTTVELSDVTVRNCFVKGFLNNVRVSREGFKSLVQGSEYDAPFTNITIENTHL